MAISRTRQNISIIIIVVLTVIMYGLIKTNSHKAAGEKNPNQSNSSTSNKISRKEKAAYRSKIMCSTHLFPVIKEVLKIYNEEHDQKTKLIHNDAYTLHNAIKRGKVPYILFTEAEHLVMELLNEEIIDSSQVKKIFTDPLLIVGFGNDIPLVPIAISYKTLELVKPDHLLAVLDTSHTTTGYLTNKILIQLKKKPGEDFDFIQYMDLDALANVIYRMGPDWTIIGRSNYLSAGFDTLQWKSVATPVLLSEHPKAFHQMIFGECETKINCFAINFNADSADWERIHNILESDSIKSVYKEYGFYPLF